VPEPVRDAAVANERFHQTITISENVIIPLSFAPKSPGTKDRVHPELVAYIEELRAERRRLSLLEKEKLEFAAHGTEAQDDGGGISSVTKARRHAERKLASARTELHRRLAFSFSCLTFPLVGLSLTFILQRWSRLVPFFLANLIVIAGFYPLLMVAVFLGESGIFPPLSLALPNLVLLAAGVALARKVERQ
jgi:lipopolysaccharide export LptBFGC system permease protein LptF